VKVRVGLLCVALVAVVAPLAASVAPAAAVTVSASTGDTTSATQSLSECAQTRRRINALFLIDESGSLKQTDPTNQRVVAVKSALASLQSLQGDSYVGRADVRVKLVGFAEDAQTLAEWRELNARSIKDLQRQAEALADRNTGRDTDYYVALDTARQHVEAEAAKAAAAGESEACTLLLWFTDGKYDIEDRLQPGPGDTLSKYYAPDIGLDQAGGGAQSVQRGKDLLCASGGVVDQLRDAQVSVAPVVLTTQIAPEDQAFLQSVASGGCGAHGSVDTGNVFAAGDVASAILSFDRAVGSVDGATTLPSETLVICITHRCGEGTHSFELTRAVRSFRLVVLTPQEGDSVEVAVPGTKQRFPVSAGKSADATIGGATLRARWSSPTVLVLTCEPSRSSSTVSTTETSEWSVVVIGRGEQAAQTAQLQLSMVTDVLPALVGTPVLHAGAAAPLTVSLRDQRGRHVVPSKFGIKSVDVTATAVDPARETPDTVAFTEAGPGRYTANYTPAADTASPSIDLQVRVALGIDNGLDLAPIVKTFPLRVAPPQGYPSISTGVLVLRPDRGKTSATGRLTVRGGASAGCIQVQSPEVDVAPDGAGTVTFATRPGPGGGTSCVRVGAGKTLNVDVRATPEQSVSGTGRATFKLVVSPPDGSNPITMAVPTRFRLARTGSGSARSCLDEGVVIASQTAVRVVEDCELKTIVDEPSTKLAVSDGAGGVVFQGDTIGDLDTGKPASPIVHIDAHGRRTTVLEDQGRQNVSLLGMTRASRPKVLYNRFDNLAPDAKATPTYFLGTFDVALHALDLASGDDIVLGSVPGIPHSDSGSYGAASGDENAVLLVGREIQFGWMELRDGHAKELLLANNPYPKDRPYGGLPYLVDASLAPDGESIATLEITGSTSTGQLTSLAVFEIATGKERFRESVPYGSSVDFDGRRAVVSSSTYNGSAAKSGVVVDTKTGDQLQLPAPGAATIATDRVRAGTTGRAASSAPVDASTFAGAWSTHVGGIKVSADGSTSINWFVNDASSRVARSGNVEINMRITEVSGLRATATVTARSDPPDVDPTIGPGQGPDVRVGDTVTLTLQAPGIVATGPRGSFKWCDDAHYGDCGA
jgi:hypothetical protein